MDTKTLMRHLKLLLLIAVLLVPACERNADPTAISGDFVPGVHRAFFIDVADEGGVWLAPRSLEALGLDTSAAEAPLLRLSWNGQTIPTRLIKGNDGWGLFFFAPAFRTRHTQMTSFLLELDESGTTLLQQESAKVTAPALPGLAHITWEENRRYLPQASATIPWFWQPIYAPGEMAHVLTLPDMAPGPLTVTVRL